MKSQKFKFSKNPYNLAITQLSPNCMYIEIIKGSAVVMISTKTELNLVNFVRHALPYIQPCRKYMFQSDIASAPGQC